MAENIVVGDGAEVLRKRLTPNYTFERNKSNVFQDITFCRGKFGAVVIITKPKPNQFDTCILLFFQIDSSHPWSYNISIATSNTPISVLTPVRDKKIMRISATQYVQTRSLQGRIPNVGSGFLQTLQRLHLFPKWDEKGTYMSSRGASARTKIYSASDGPLTTQQLVIPEYYSRITSIGRREEPTQEPLNPPIQTPSPTIGTIGEVSSFSGEYAGRKPLGISITRLLVI